MKVVAISIITEKFGLADAARVETVEQAVAKFIKGLVETLGGAKIEMVLVATECGDDDFSHQIEKKMFEAVPELFHKDYVWAESY